MQVSCQLFREVFLRQIFISLLLLLLMTSPLQAAVPLSSSGAALREARAFLSLLDQHRYAAAWSVGTRYFKTRLTVTKWQQIMVKHREPLGEVRARKRISLKHIDSFDSAPVGQYMQIEFSTRFKRKTQLERLVFQRDTDGYWRISSYKLR